jgi:hypothetical protein
MQSNLSFLISQLKAGAGFVSLSTETVHYARLKISNSFYSNKTIRKSRAFIRDSLKENATQAFAHAPESGKMAIKPKPLMIERFLEQKQQKQTS